MGGERGRRVRAVSRDHHGAYVTARPLHGRRQGDLALDATLRAAAPFQRVRRADGSAGRGLVLCPADAREKVRERRAGSAILFAVDGSGSMRTNQRMVEAKAAVLSLLVDAYHKRDRVGMLAFRGQRAELLLPLTTSVERARRLLVELPTGGKTPLAEGLDLGREVLERERLRTPECLPLLVVVSDGNANASRWGRPLAEARAAAAAIGRAGIPLVFLDTDERWEEPGMGRTIARLAGGTYASVDHLSAAEILRALMRVRR